MGLDMYLSAKKCVGGWGHSKTQPLFDALTAAAGIPPTPFDPRVN